MFTGIIETLGTIKGKTLSRQGMQMVIEPDLKWKDILLGESIAVNGTCLTVTEVTGTAFAVDVSPETLSRTTLGRSEASTRVNLERALKPSDRLGGHIVTGHVDACGTISKRREQADFTLFYVGIPEQFGKYIIEKGSIAVDGISLTINECTARSFSVSIIPFTAGHTTMGLRKEGDTVNLEFDVIAKYIERLLAVGNAPARENKKDRKDISLEFLSKHGIL